MENMNKTFSIKAKEVDKKWVILDAEDQILGRLATKTAMILRGKHKATYTPSMDMGDNVIIINAEKIKLTGLKAEKKVYRWHSLFPGGLKERSFSQVSSESPEKIIEHAVRGMLPKTKLGKKLFQNLKVYQGAEHPHIAQNPVKIALDVNSKEQ